MRLNFVTEIFGLETHFSAEINIDGDPEDIEIETVGGINFDTHSTIFDIGYVYEMCERFAEENWQEVLKDEKE